MHVLAERSDHCIDAAAGFPDKQDADVVHGEPIAMNVRAMGLCIAEELPQYRGLVEIGSYDGHAAQVDLGKEVLARTRVALGCRLFVADIVDSIRPDVKGVVLAAIVDVDRPLGGVELGARRRRRALEDIGEGLERKVCRYSAGRIARNQEVAGLERVCELPELEVIRPEGKVDPPSLGKVRGAVLGEEVGQRARALVLEEVRDLCLGTRDETGVEEVLEPAAEVLNARIGKEQAEVGLLHHRVPAHRFKHVDIALRGSGRVPA